MGQLPVDRVNISRPFTKVGVDYAGPFFLNSVGGRNPKITKGYVCVFVCLVVKAVHLEYAGDLSTEAFIAALKRFVSRRGLPAKILCDGGTNFLGAKNEMKEFKQFISSYSHQNQISKYFVDQGIEYVVNPPHSPHHGGIFEAAVKSMKYHLVRVIGERRLTIEEFITLLAEIEATLNSRPITPLSTDSNDFNFLSPAHFLVGGSLKAIPQENLMDAKLWSLSRWQMMQYISQQFFKQWSTQYIQGLQKSSKWYQQHPNVGVGTMVLLNNSDSSIGPQKWTLGRISKIHPGADSLVRVVDVQVPVLCNITKSKTGVKLVTYTRPITKISPLPMDGDLDER